MSPFFLKQYVKSRHDVFEAYPMLLTEMALRLPYQVKKITDATVGNDMFGSEWHGILCDYMANHQTPYVRRQVSFENEASKASKVFLEARFKV